MANVIYPSAKKAFMDGGIDLLNDDIVIVLVDSGYTYSSTHEFLDDVPSAARVHTTDPLTNKTTTGGVFDADDVEEESVSGDPVTAMLFVQDTGNEETSRLIAHFDNASGSWPFTPNGGPLSITFHSSGIFAI